MSPHRAATDHVCSTASMTRCAWRTLIIALVGSPDVKVITDVSGFEEIEFMNGTALHVNIIHAF